MYCEYRETLLSGSQAMKPSLFCERFKDEDVRHTVSCVRTIEVCRSGNHRSRSRPDAQKPWDVRAESVAPA